MHTSASFDCTTDPKRLAMACRHLGLSPLVITDHDTTVAAVQLHALLGQQAIVGEEITTKDGELIGLFLQRPIAPHHTAADTATEIKRQGGLVYLEHPYDEFRRHLNETAVEEIADLIDIVEVFNGRSEPKANQRAEDLCSTLGAVPGAGSDAHTIGEIGKVFVEMDDFAGPAEFLDSLRRGRIVKGRSQFRLMIEAKLPHRMPRR